MIIPSGSTDRKMFFVAVDSTDLKTRVTGLSSFTVYRSRDGGAATAYTTPTVAELSSANMPGVYVLTLDEDTTIAAGHDSEEYCVHITAATMASVTRTLDIQRVKFTEGQSATMANNAVDADLERVAGATTDVAALATNVAAILVDTGTTLDGRIPASLVSGRMDASVGAIAANAITAASINAAALNGKGDWNIGKTGYALSAAGVQAIWDALTSALTVVGSVGKLIVDNLNATITSRQPSGSVSIAAGGIASTAFAAGAIDSAALAASAGQEIADEVLNRDIAGGGSGGARIVRDALRALRNRVRINSGTLEVYQENDSTVAWSAPVTTSAGNPVTEVDPT
jgi:hypothetical protein